VQLGSLAVTADGGNPHRAWPKAVLGIRTADAAHRHRHVRSQDPCGTACHVEDGVPGHDRSGPGAQDLALHVGRAAGDLLGVNAGSRVPTLRGGGEVAAEVAADRGGGGAGEGQDDARGPPAPPAGGERGRLERDADGVGGQVYDAYPAADRSA
jgi:hypothetical protein